MTDEPVLLCAIEAGVAVVTLNRPTRLNAFDAALGRAFDRQMVTLASDHAVRAIVLTGAGRGFCAGADAQALDTLERTPEALAARPPGTAHALLDTLDAPPELRTRYLLPAALRKPVIAAVNGACAGIGLALACYSDVRFAATEAVFAAAFTRRGLIAEAGLAWTLPRLIGAGPAADLLLSGRRVAADEALRMGLVTRVTAADALLPAATDYAADLARNVSPRSLRVVKRQLWAAQGQSLREALSDGHSHLQASLRSADFREAVQAAREKRAPEFPDPVDAT